MSGGLALYWLQQSHHLILSVFIITIIRIIKCFQAEVLLARRKAIQKHSSHQLCRCIYNIAFFCMMFLLLK